MDQDHFKFKEVTYSLHTKRAHGAVIEIMFGDDEAQQLKVLKDLAKSVHCDLAGELRLPHGAPIAT